MQQTFEEISQLSEEKQNNLAVYIQKHLNELLQNADREKRISEGTYTINDFNEETQQMIRNIEQDQNLTVCENKNDLYHQLGI